MGKIICKADVAILMATYNGGKFIKEQIESILNQTYRNWMLYIQDDGSTDNTIEIIKSFKDDRIKLIDVGLTHQGACNNFMSLLNMVEAPSYMFCDQDDYWKNFKIQLQLKELWDLEKNNPNLPILIYSDKSRTDQNLIIKIEKEFNKKNLSQTKLNEILEKRNTFNLALLRSTGAGCTMCFNQITKDVSFPFLNLRYQDSIILLSVLKHKGIVKAMTLPTILYRTHENNTIGSKGDISVYKKFKSLKNTINNNKRAWYLWKIYGGGNIWKFFKAKYFLSKTRYI